MTEEEFKKLSKVERYHLLRDDGVFLASRMFNGYQVGLFRIGNMHAEVWKRIGFTGVDYIEAVDEKKVREAYLDNLNLPPI